VDSPEIQSRAARRKAFAVHVLTASGAITGLLALQSVIDGNIRAALLWLIACQILDGIDGPIARKYDTVTHAPHIDGHILDLVVDYVTCVVVPVAFLVRLHLLPDHWQMILAALIIFTSALWFARSDLETDDAWFNGFCSPYISYSRNRKDLGLRDNRGALRSSIDSAEIPASHESASNAKDYDFNFCDLFDCSDRAIC